jgi:uncharacterized protein YhaN
MGTKSNIDQLNSFLRGEISAVETYRMALEKLDKSSTTRAEIETNMRSHQVRVRLLEDQIRACGGEPAKTSGPWGVLAKAIEGSARLFGDKAAVAALEQGEDHGLKDYKSEVDDKDLDFEAHLLLVSRLLPLQEQTHDRMSMLKSRLP